VRARREGTIYTFTIHKERIVLSLVLQDGTATRVAGTLLNLTAREFGGSQKGQICLNI
jgi:hypothetical protein